MQNGGNKNTKTTVLGRSAANELPGFFYATNYLTKGVRHMGLFSKKNTKELPPLMSDAEINGASYEQVLDFLVSVNNDDFDKIVKVAGVYRVAHKDVAQITGLTAEQTPSIFDQDKGIVTPIGGDDEPAKPDTEAGNFLDGDDDLAAAFLDDDEKPAAPIPGTSAGTAGTTAPVGETVTPTATKVEVKDAPAA